VAVGAFAAVDASAMSVNAVRVPLIQILIEDFAEMTVSTSVLVNQGVLIEAASGMSISANKLKFGVLTFAGVSNMVVAGNLKWLPEGDTPETWDAIADNSETWTPVNDTAETWNAIADNGESWTPIADNSETWQIAA
jgi:hypothetical protein